MKQKSFFSFSTFTTGNVNKKMDIFCGKFDNKPKYNLKAREATFSALVWGGSSIMKNHPFNYLTF